MRPGSSGSPSREAFFELQLVGEKRGWILRQQRCPNVSRARRSHETLTHFCLGQRKLAPPRQRPAACRTIQAVELICACLSEFTWPPFVSPRERQNCLKFPKIRYTRPGSIT